MLSNRLPIVCAVALLLLTAGCLGAVGFGDDGTDPDSEEEPSKDDELPDADDLLEKSMRAETTVDDLHGVQTTTIESGEEVDEATYEVWMRGADESRMELLAADGSDEFDVLVSSGATTWMYDEDANQAVRMDLEFEPDDLEALDEALTDAFFANTTATVDGTATVADREAYVLELEPDGDDAMYDSATLWIDRETHYPLKQESTMSLTGDETTVSVAFEEVDFDSGLDDDVFTFEPPADAEIVDANDFTSAQFDDVDEAAAFAPFNLPDPEVPASYELERVSVSENIAGWSASFWYADDDGATLSVTAVQSDDDGDAVTGPAGDRVEVGDTEAIVREFDGPETTTTTLEWSDGDLSYAVSGDLEIEALIAVAESILE